MLIICFFAIVSIIAIINYTLIPFFGKTCTFNCLRNTCSSLIDC